MSSLEKPPSSSKLTLFSLYKELELSLEIEMILPL